MLNVLNLQFIARADESRESITRIYNLTNLIKFFSAFVLLSDTLFIFFVGQEPKDPNSNTLDANLRKLYPLVYNNLDLIGFRIYDNPITPYTEEEKKHILKLKFMSYIAYLMVAIYLSNLYSDKWNDSAGEEGFDEETYAKIFEYQLNSLESSSGEKLKSKKRKYSIDENTVPE